MPSRIIGIRPCKGSIAAASLPDRICHTRLLNVLLFLHMRIGNASLLRVRHATPVPLPRVITRTRIIHAPHQPLQTEQRPISPPKVFHLCSSPAMLPHPPILLTLLNQTTRRNQHTEPPSNSPTSTPFSPPRVPHQAVCNSLPSNKTSGNAVSANPAIHQPLFPLPRVQLPAITAIPSKTACVLTVCSVDDTSPHYSTTALEQMWQVHDMANDGVWILYRDGNAGRTSGNFQRIGHSMGGLYSIPNDA